MPKNQPIYNYVCKLFVLGIIDAIIAKDYY